ncbi:MAG: DUF2062 domain-containing protein [Pseudomonadota bacterium]
MPIKRLAAIMKRYAPARETLLGNRFLRPVADYLGDPNVWHFNRHSVARGVALGLFLGFAIPIGFQIFVAALIAVSTRANIAVAALFTGVSNPITAIPIYLGALKTGDWLLGRDPTMLMGGTSVTDIIRDAPVPTIIGCIFLGAISASVGFLTIHFLWRYWITQRWAARLARRRRSA